MILKACCFTLPRGEKDQKWTINAINKKCMQGQEKRNFYFQSPEVKNKSCRELTKGYKSNYVF